MNRLKLIVVGVGALGQHHARKLAAFADVDLIGVVDQRRAQGESVAAACETCWYPDLPSVPQPVDGAIVAVPTVAHHAVASELLKSGTSVLIEKPLAASLAESRALHALATENGATIQVGHIERFNPAFEILQEHVTRPLYVRGQRVSPYAFRSMDIGVVHDLMVHDIDLVLALTGSRVASVEAFGAVTIGPHEDFATARLRMTCGAIVDLTAGRMCPEPERSLQVWDRRGHYTADLHRRTVTVRTAAEPFATHPARVHELIRKSDQPTELKAAVFRDWIREQQLSGDQSDALEAELRDFVTHLKTGLTPRVPSSEALKTMEIAEMVLAALAVHSYQSAPPIGLHERAA